MERTGLNLGQDPLSSLAGHRGMAAGALGAGRQRQVKRKSERVNEHLGMAGPAAGSGSDGLELLDKVIGDPAIQASRVDTAVDRLERPDVDEVDEWFLLRIGSEDSQAVVSALQLLGWFRGTVKASAQRTDHPRSVGALDPEFSLHGPSTTQTTMVDDPHEPGIGANGRD